MITTTSFGSIIASQKHHPTEWLWRRCLAINSQFCEAVVKAGYLTWEQMVSAACRYRLGATRQGGVIFWQIDQEERVRDGKVMYYRTDCHRDKITERTVIAISSITRRGCLPSSTNGIHFPTVRMRRRTASSARICSQRMVIKVTQKSRKSQKDLKVRLKSQMTQIFFQTRILWIIRIMQLKLPQRSPCQRHFL